MEKIFSVQDRQNAFEFVLSAARENDRIIEVMEYMHQKISGMFEVLFFTQSEPRHLQNYVLSNLLEIDIGYGGYTKTRRPGNPPSRSSMTDPVPLRRR